MRTRHWQDWVSLIVGLWLFFTPIVFDYDSQAAMVNAFVVGMVIVLIESTAVTVPGVWEEVAGIAAGLWLLVAPVVLGFTVHRNETETAVIVGLCLMALSAWALMRDQAFRKWWQDHHLIS